MIIEFNELLKEEIAAKQILDEVAIEELMEIRQDAIVSCGAFGNDCNGLDVMFINIEVAA